MLKSERMYECLVCGKITAGRVEIEWCPPAPICSEACALIVLAGCDGEISSPPGQDTTRTEIVVPGVNVAVVPQYTEAVNVA